jgi:A/G-specific adenine glycosylase
LSAPASGDALRARLVPGYRASARDLPWRRDPSPYHILLSELMCQQTRIDTAVPYFHRFTARWPTIEAFAAASAEDVLTMWAGLGYYRRARLLHQAAQAAVAGGGLPSDPVALAALPGIGAYTAGAIASIAFGVPAAAVDGNVERVISRVDRLDADPRSKAGKQALGARVQAIHAPGVASEVTQGLMELGATVCTPRAPRCDLCPWTDLCVARPLGDVTAYPKLPPRKAAVAARAVAGILRRGERVLCGRRPEGLLGGLWEPVGAELGEGDDAVDALRAAFAARAGLPVRVGARRGQIVHVFTHRRLTVEVYEVSAEGDVVFAGDGTYTQLAWLAPDGDGVGWSKLAQKILAAAPVTAGHVGDTRADAG